MSAAEKENEDLSNLRLIVRDSVLNRATQMMLWHSVRWSGFSKSDAKGYREYTKYHSSFFALLGSIDGASTMEMLIDHKAEIGEGWR